MHYSVPPNLPKMREIEGNLKKSYGKLAAQIWLGPCHWIKTQSDRSCFLSDIHKNCLCHTWVVCLILRRELRMTGDETQRTIWTRRKRSEAMSRHFSLSLLPFARMRERLRGTRKGCPTPPSVCTWKHNTKLSRGSLLPWLVNISHVSSPMNTFP